MAYVNGGCGLWVRSTGVWFLGGVASEETGAWPKDGSELGGGGVAYGDGGRGLWVRSKGAWSVGAWLPSSRGRGQERGARWEGKKEWGVAYGMGGVAYG